MFLQLIKRRISSKKMLTICAISALSLCIGCIHSYRVIINALSTGYKSHAYLTDVIVGPNQSTQQFIQGGLLFTNLQKTLSNATLQIK